MSSMTDKAIEHVRQEHRVEAYTVADIASSCDVTEKAVRKWIERGYLVPDYKIAVGHRYVILWTKASVDRIKQQHVHTITKPGGRQHGTTQAGRRS